MRYFALAVTCLAASVPSFGDGFTASVLCDLLAVNFCKNAQIVVKIGGFTANDFDDAFIITYFPRFA